MAALLETRGLRAFYGQTQALFDIDLVVEQGGVTAVLGANGAGKTTLLRALCAMTRREGEIFFDGAAFAPREAEDAARRGIAHAPDGRGTFLDLHRRRKSAFGRLYAKGPRWRRPRFRASVRLFPAPRGAARPAGGNACRAASSKCSRLRAP